MPPMDYVAAPGSSFTNLTLGNGDTLTISSGGVASTTTVAGGEVIIQSGGLAAGLLETSGTVTVSGSASGAVISGGNFQVIGGAAIGTLIADTGYVDVSASGTASGAIVASGGDLSVFFGGGDSGTTITSGGTEYVQNNGLSLAATVGSGGAFNVQLGGIASGTLVNAGGRETVQGFGGSFVGSAIAAQVGSGGLLVNSGLTKASVISSGGYEIVLSGAVASATDILSGGVLIALPGAHIYGTFGAGASSSAEIIDVTPTSFIVNPPDPAIITSGSTEYVLSGGIASGAILLGGATQLVAGGTTSATLVTSGGSQYVEAGEGGNGGIAYDTTIGSGGALVLSQGGTLAHSLVFSGSGGVFYDDALGASSAPLPVISGFTPGDMIVLENFTPIGTPTISGNILTVSNANGNVSLTFDSAAGEHLLAASDGQGDTDITATPLCYLAGTRILTPTGEAPVETLAIGDLVVTRFGGIQPIKWIGRQSYDRRFLKNNRSALPVRIRAGALGEASPLRDLFISPGHAMLCDETLLLASALVNGVTITQNFADAPAAVEYYQIELEAHDCVIAEGAWSETFADGPGLRAKYHNAADFYARYPDAPAPRTLQLCAPRPERGAALEAALHPIVARAAAGLTAGPLEGAIDLVTTDRIEGWALDLKNPELPVLLEIMIDDLIIGSVLACAPRADLARAGKGAGKCAFFFDAREPLPATAPERVRITRAGGGPNLPMTPACLGFPKTPARRSGR